MAEHEETLDQALSRVWEHDWRHRRSGATLRSQVEKAFASLSYRGLPPGTTRTAIVGQPHINQITKDWYDAGLSPATIQKRLNCLSKLGVNVQGCRVNVPKQLKWYLREDMKPSVLAYLRRRPGAVHSVLADLIEWTTLTGLRIEESLRLTWDDITINGHGLPVEMTVPGLKTATSQATLPVAAAAAMVLIQGECGETQMGSVFNLQYETIVPIWNELRAKFGWQDDPTATLKALRRSAARYLHVDCGMPLDMVRQYLRHEKIETTMEYLRLTGGYGTEEMRRYLK